MIMEQYPLLFFPYARQSVKDSRPLYVQSHVSFPNAERQSERLTPVFQSLCSAVESMSIQIQEGQEGIDPETVLVLKTVGTINDFANAVKRIEGLEWLGEFDIDDIIPDEDFFDTRNPESNLSGRLYLVSTNLNAIRELLSLWQRYLSNPDASFDRGYSKFKEVFKQLQDIRRWNYEDRFEGTFAKEYWQEQIDAGQDIIRFEIELWYRNNDEQLSNSFNRVHSLIDNLGGNVISRCSIKEIKYAAVLVELSARNIQTLIEQDDIALVKCEDIMFFRPSGQMAFRPDGEGVFQLPELEMPQIQAIGQPVIGIFDGYPMSNHAYLSNRLVIDDPDNYASSYAASEMIHGTAMCSLIIKGDLSKDEEYITSPLYVRPIMKPNPHALNREEHVPSDCLLVDVIHRAVREMYEGTNGQRPSAPSVKVINLSIGDPARMYLSSISPLAKLLDWLSYKYSILFIISAGNHSESFNLPYTEALFRALSRTAQEKAFVDILIANRRNKRILSPAESINNISVGAIHYDDSTIRNYEQRINPFDALLPTTYTSFGYGHKNSIKPDFVYDGGRQLFQPDVLRFSPLMPKCFPSAPPGHKVASPNDGINGAIYSIGTSNAAALTTRRAYFCHKTIEDLAQRHAISNKHIAILIKAMLVHGCSWERIGDSIESYLNPAMPNNEKKQLKARWIGYGYPDINKSLECNPQRATVIGLGVLEKGKAELYQLPIPECLNAKTYKRKLTVTLSWISPITVANQKYRNARLWFDVGNPIITPNKEDVADQRVARRGTIQHEVFVGSNAVAIGDANYINIKVSCDKDASNITEEIPYALIVSLEVAPGIDLPIYQEISEKITTNIPIRIDG